MQGARKAPFSGPAREFGCNRVLWVPDSMKFNSIYRMAKVERCVDCLVKEVIEIQLCPMNFNRDRRFMLSRTRQLLLQQVWNISSENRDQTQQYFTAFQWLGITVITINISTTRTAYKVLLFS